MGSNKNFGTIVYVGVAGFYSNPLFTLVFHSCVQLERDGHYVSQSVSQSAPIHQPQRTCDTVSVVMGVVLVEGERVW